MFGKFKEKLKGWFKSSSEKVEETAEKKQVEIEKEEEKPDLEKLKKELKEKQEKIKEIKREKEEKLEKEIPQKTPETVEEAKEEIKETQEKASEIQKIEEFDKVIEQAKKQEIKEPPMKFNVGAEKFEPDLERIKKEIKEKEEKIREIKQEREKRKSIFTKIRSTFTYKISKEEFNEIFDDLELLLLENNVALEVVDDLKKRLSEKLIGKEIRKEDLESEIRKELKNALNEILIEPDNPLEYIREKSEKPFVILFFGINGTGKTTSIAKIAYFLKKSGISVVLAAADTFRAASIEQISEHAKKLNIPIIKHDYGSDPTAVAFDAIKYAKNHKIDVVLIDTAGRMHTKSNLIAEIGKISRVTEPDLKIFVAESIAGNDATEQAKTFHEAIDIDGSILSKVDVDEKGGTIISISHATNKPIFYLGTGQKYEDLELFNKQKFIENLGL